MPSKKPQLTFEFDLKNSDLHHELAAILPDDYTYGTSSGDEFNQDEYGKLMNATVYTKLQSEQDCKKFIDKVSCTTHCQLNPENDKKKEPTPNQRFRYRYRANCKLKKSKGCPARLLMKSPIVLDTDNPLHNAGYVTEVNITWTHWKDEVCLSSFTPPPQAPSITPEEEERFDAVINFVITNNPDQADAHQNVHLPPTSHSPASVNEQASPRRSARMALKKRTPERVAPRGESPPVKKRCQSRLNKEKDPDYTPARMNAKSIGTAARESGRDSSDSEETDGDSDSEESNGDSEETEGDSAQTDRGSSPLGLQQVDQEADQEEQVDQEADQEIARLKSDLDNANQRNQQLSLRVADLESSLAQANEENQRLKLRVATIRRIADNQQSNAITRGFVIPDENILLGENPDGVAKILEAFRVWKSSGTADWSLALHSQLVLDLEPMKKSLASTHPLNKAATELLSLFRKYRTDESVFVLDDHECDRQNRAASKYLPCIRSMKAKDADAKFVLLTNMTLQGVDANNFTNAGVMVMNLQASQGFLKL